jgi:subtilisin family serine protease
MAGGTSMSAPLTSGVIAMLLQINPALSPQEIKDLLSKTAIKDAYTGVIPAAGSNTWGKGKVNAMGAIRELLSPTTGIVHSISNPQGILVYPNPGNGRFQLEWIGIQNGEEINLTVMDALGRQVKSISYQSDGNPFSIDLLGLKPGQYFIRLVSKNESAFIRLVNK